MKGNPMQTISTDTLEINLQKYFAQIHQSGEDVVVTDKGVPIIKLTPLKPNMDVAEAFKDLQGKIKYHDDILKPETEEWGEA